MGVIETQIAKAVARFGPDVAAAIKRPVDVKPWDILSGEDTALKRYDFLAATLPDPSDAADVLERILFGNELQPVNYFQRGAVAARAVARIAIRSSAGSGWGTGFLICPGVLLTNNHVLPTASVAKKSLAQFDFEFDLGDEPIGPVDFEFRPDGLFHTSVELDFTVVQVAEQSIDGAIKLEAYGYLPLVEEEGKAFEGEWLTIIQHPAGERKQACVRENKLLKRSDQVLWYATDTMAGSSGSPVFNNDWYIVALHHSGVPETKNGVIQTIDGTPYDPNNESNIRWIANEGIRASRIVKALKAALPDHPLLQSLFRMTPEAARTTAIAVTQAPPEGSKRLSHPISTKKETLMPDSPSFPIDVRIRINADGSAAVIDTGRGNEANFEAASKPKKRIAAFDAPFDYDYSNRKGYRANFLESSTPVGLPIISDGMLAEVAPLIKKQGKNDHILHYGNYSVVMHAKRRMAIYSAANVDFAQRFELPRPEDTWRRDPRIKAEHQLENWYYASNDFDRGHLTRREDAEYGSDRVAALLAAADTCHWTNCVPQHKNFNQNREIWQGIERYILEETIFDSSREIRAQVITGPIFEEVDPEYRKIAYPLQFWKIVVALDDTMKLVATAYLASQAEIIATHGIEAAPFGQFLHFQTTVAEIERLTSLTFIGKDATEPLRDTDPLLNSRVRRRVTAAAQEASVPGSAGPYRQITDLEDIVL